MKPALCLFLLAAGSSGAAWAPTVPLKSVDTFALYDHSLRAYAPEGPLAFAVVPQMPGGGSVFIGDVAVDPAGGFVLLAGTPSTHGLVFLGKYGRKHRR